MPLLIPTASGPIRKSVPFGMTFLLMLMGVALPSSLPALAAMPPLLTYCAVYYWSVHRADLLPLPLLFILGLLADALLRLPFGVTALSLVLIAYLVQLQRPIFTDQSYRTLWLGFAVILSLTLAMQWLLLSLLAHHALPWLTLVLQGGLTLALFPLLTWLQVLLHRHIVT
ncbi:MAG: rod shape-determining protein MreD [Alphaproteobacteria bacterium]|nr:rod shape-determining protein MreD [Alphaproteobacteria bacterium]